MSARSSSSAAQRSHLRVVEGGGDSQRPSFASDDEIIAAVERGDNRLAGQLYDRLIPIVDTTIYRLLGRRETDHDDLVQCTFEQVVLTITRKKFARACSLTTWAATVAAHVALNALRSRTRERRVVDRHAGYDADAVQPQASQNPEREVGAKRDLERLRQNLAAMDPDKAETVVLHDVLGHELAEVATTMGVTVAAAQSRLARGRRELIARMEHHDSAGSGGREP